MNILVNAPTGEQHIIKVGEGGGYFDAGRILWDERTDGPLPSIKLGGMVRVDGALEFSQELFDASTSARSAASQAEAWERIKAERDRRKVLGVFASGHWFHSDADSRIQQLSLFVMGAAVPAIQWKTLTASGAPVFVTMTQGLAAAIFQATAASDAAVFGAAEAHRVAMEASDSPEAYDFSGGWPDAFGDA